VPTPEADLRRQRRVVDAFYAAARDGNFDALVQVLDPDVVLRTDVGADRPPVVVRGAAAVARFARQPRGAKLYPVLVNGVVGAFITIDGQPFSIRAFTVVDDRIVAIDGIRDPQRVKRLTPR
jgi:RNA polymerase sigma-70 factor (ECF subfamily)